LRGGRDKPILNYRKEKGGRRRKAEIVGNCSKRLGQGRGDDIPLYCGRAGGRKGADVTSIQLGGKTEDGKKGVLVE